MINLLQRITKNFKDSEMIHGYIAISVATKLSEPLSKIDIINALETIDLANNVSHDSERFKNILKVHAEAAEKNWQAKKELIKAGRQALKRDKYSFEASVYKNEKTKKGPSSSEERAKWKTLSSNIKEAEEKFNIAEANYNKRLEEEREKNLNARAEAALQKIIAEVEEEKKIFGEKSKEQILEEREELLREIRTKLKKVREEKNN
jgi:hypothetical protein